MPGLSPRRDGVGQVVNLRADCQSAPVAVGQGTLWVARSLATCPQSGLVIGEQTAK